MPIMIAQLRAADYSKFDLGKVYMFILLAILPVLVVYIILSKSIIKGVTAGSVKGQNSPRRPYTQKNCLPPLIPSLLRKATFPQRKAFLKERPLPEIIREGVFSRILQSLFPAGHQEDGPGDGKSRGKHQVGSLAAGHTGGVHIIKCNGPKKWSHQPHRVSEQPERCQERQLGGALHQSGNAKLFQGRCCWCIAGSFDTSQRYIPMTPAHNTSTPRERPSRDLPFALSVPGPGTDTGPKDRPWTQSRPTGSHTSQRCRRPRRRAMA